MAKYPQEFTPEVIKYLEAYKAGLFDPLLTLGQRLTTVVNTLHAKGDEWDGLGLDIQRFHLYTAIVLKQGLRRIQELANTLVNRFNEPIGLALDFSRDDLHLKAFPPELREKYQRIAKGGDPEDKKDEDPGFSFGVL